MKRMKPRILIPADISLQTSEFINLNHANFVPRPVVDAILRAGGLPIVLPYSLDEEDVVDYMSMGDAVMFLGGPDITPSFYHEKPDSHLTPLVYNRDAFELMILKAALKVHKTIFGICRGAQLINVGLGGSVYQDIDTMLPDTYIQHAQDLAGDLPVHDVLVAQGSHLAQVVGAHPYVNSRHHQAIHQLGHGLKVTAKAPDGIVEGIESTQGSEILAVQWHPENLAHEQAEDQALFDDFIQRTKQNMAQVHDVAQARKIS